jgi:hypothetical protein
MPLIALNFSEKETDLAGRSIKLEVAIFVAHAGLCTALKRMVDAHGSEKSEPTHGLCGPFHSMSRTHGG